MKAIKKHKKASIADMVISFAFLLILVIFGGVSLFIYGAFNDAWQESTIIDNVSKQASEDHNTRMINILDGAIVLFFVILWIVSLVTAFFLDSNPVFFVLFVIISILSLIGIVGMSQILGPLEESDLASGFADLPISTFIIDNSIWFAIAYMLSVGGALYFKIGGRE